MLQRFQPFRSPTNFAYDNREFSALDQVGETFVSRGPCLLAGMARQQRASSTTRRNSRDPWPYRRPQTPEDGLDGATAD